MGVNICFFYIFILEMNNLVNVVIGFLVVLMGVLIFGFNNKLVEWYINLK